MERYFIYDARGNKQGNLKGYKTHKGAQTQVDNRLYPLLEQIGKEENPTPGVYANVLVAKIKLEQVEDDYVTIVRVEESTGYGMYNGLWFSCSLPCDDNHPTVDSDSLYRKDLKKKGFSCTWEPSGHRFGFLNLQMLRCWIYNDKWIAALSKKGAVICTYKVPTNHVILGRTQLTFMHDKAVLIDKKPLASILE